jgi:hypothetical protein
MTDISEDKRQPRLAWKRVCLFAVAIAGGVGAAKFGQPYIHDNDRAINVIVTAFSILAGFLVAIMTIVGDPAVFSRRSWQVHELMRPSMYNSLLRQRWLFMLYLGTLAAIFAESLIPKESAFIPWLERLYLGMAVAAFVISFGLPNTLLRIQMARYDEALESRRRPEKQARQRSDDAHSGLP